MWALLATVAIGAVLVPSSRGAEAAPSSLRAQELVGLRTAYSRTVAEADGRLTTTVSSVPLHFRDGPRGWKPILSRLIASERAGFAWRNERAAFKAELKAESADRAVRFEAGSARLALTLEGAERVPAVKDRESGLVYENVFAQTDLEYALLPTGLKETLVLKRPGAPNEFVFRVESLEGSQFTLERRRDGGIDVRTPGAAEPAAVISAPIVNDSRPITISSAGGSVAALADSLPAAGKASMVLAGDPAGGYRITLGIDRAWLENPARVYPVKLDPTVTTAVDLQDGYWNMQCATCTPETVGNALVVSKDGVGSFSNGTTQHSSGLVFSLGDIPAGATITSARLDMYQTGCYPGSCQFFYPEDGEGQSGQVELRRFTTAWGGATPTSALSTDSTVLAATGFSMVWNADQPGAWKSWSGAGLTAHVQGVVNGATPNYGIQAALAPAYYGWGPVFASSESADPNLAPKLEIQWVADGVQLNPSTNVHSDGPELTWSRFATGYGPYPASVLQDSPRAYWRMNDAAGSPFGLADWSGNSLHASPIGVAPGEDGATADGDTAVYYNGSSSRTEASESQITDTFTVEAWIKRGALGGKQTIFSRGESNGGGFRLAIDTNNTLVLTSGDYDGGSFRIFARSSTTIGDTTAWHHVAATKSGQNVKLYIDGTDVTTIVETIPTLTSGLGLVVTGAAIGSDYVNGGRWYAEHFNGWIDEPAVYASVLPEARLDAHIAAKAEPANGFQRFEVHRSLASGFTPSAASLIATVRDPAIQYYRDTSAKAATAFYYKVVTVGTNGSYTSNQLAVTTPAAGNGTITVQPGVSLLGAEATTLASGSVCANNGGAGGITASSSQRGLLRFDLRQVPTGSTVSSAAVSLWTFQDGGGRTINLHRVTGDWNEGAGAGGCDGSGASWTDRQANVPWSAGGGDYEAAAASSFASGGSTPHWESASLTSLVQEWVAAGKPNLGLLVRHASEAGAPAITWTSDDYSGSAALRPKLVVSYADGSDPKEPSARMGAPGEGARVSGAATVTAAAGDDSKVTQVEFLHGPDDTVYATDTSAPWQATLNSASLPNGALVLRARATDDVGHVTTSSPITVTVANSAAPTTSITATSGAATLSVEASAADDVSMAKVEFYVDGDRFATDTTNPYTATLDTLGFPVYDGQHTLTTRAYDGDGNVTTSAGYPVTVANTAGTKYRASFPSSGLPQTVAAAVPVGTIVAYSGEAIPSGWALADGSALSRSGYADLFAALGTSYGAGDGSTTFSLPDLRGRFPLGKASDGTGSALGASGGSLDAGAGSYSLSWPAHTFTVPQAPDVSVNGLTAHSHTWTGSSSSFKWEWYQAPAPGTYNLDSAGATGSMTSSLGSLGATTVSSSTATQSVAVGSSNPPFVVVRYLISTTAAAAPPACAIWGYGGASAPAATVLAQGQAASGTATGCLAAGFGGNLPDLRQRFPLGQAASGTGSTLGGSGGAIDATRTVTLGSRQYTTTVPGHTHTLTMPSHTHSVQAPSTSGYDPYRYDPFNLAVGSIAGTSSANSDAGSGYASSSAGGGTVTATTAGSTTTTAANNPPFQAINFVTATGSYAAPAIGTITTYAGSSEPTGWLKADGRCLPQSSYADLYALVGSGYGSCPAGQFKLPDLRQRFPLGKAGSGTGAALGASGGTINSTDAIVVAGDQPALTVAAHSHSWSLPNHTHTIPTNNPWDYGFGCCGGEAHFDATASFTSSADGGQTVASASEPAQTLTANETSSTQTLTTAASNPAYQVVDYLIASGVTVAADRFIPSELRYDPAASTQESAPITVNITNDSTAAWTAATTFLRYRWVAPDGTVTSSADISLGTDLPAGASRAINADVLPPALPAGVLRSLYKLRFDLHDGSYFATQGNKPLEANVLITSATPLELGLERYQQYEPLDLGGGLTASANLANGNLVVSGNLLDNPGRGLSTLVDLAYNSQEPASFAPAGNGVTLGSGLTRLGQPLDIHPNPADTAAGRTAKWIGFADGDGSYHRFLGRSIGGGKTYYDEPAGVHLYLRATGSADPSKYWALTRPDRTSFYFDQDGWPTRVEDANGNALVYTLATVPAGEDAYGLAKRVTKITDAGGRDVTLAYYAAADSPTTAVRGKLKSLTDHAGRLTRLDYYDDGNLLRLTQAGGVGDDGSFSPARSLTFAYTDAAGTAAAIPTLAARQNPDPSTNQGRLLYSLIDYRGNESTFAYATTGAIANRLASWTDRAGKTTSFSYNTAVPATTVARPLARTSSYEFDAAGRVTEITNPLGLTTTISWTSGNNVSQIANDTTGRSTAYAYNANGYLTSSTDELGNETRLAYENLAVDADDASANWPAGRSIPHISQLDTQTLPEGVASPAAGDYMWSFDYTPTGNLWKVFDPLGKVTTHTYNADGTLASMQLPDNGDTITRLTSYEEYDGNGLATRVRDAAGNRATAGYGADGRPLWVQDPIHSGENGPDTRSYRQVFDYDGYGRHLRTSAPKSSTWARGLLVWSESRYDANDNLTASVAPYYAIEGGGYGSVTTTGFDVMDREISVVGPDSSSGGTEETRTAYDDAGRPFQTIAPKGIRTDALAGDYTTITGFDLLDRPTTVTEQGLDANDTRTSAYCYDAAGDLRSVTGPKSASGFTCPSATVWPYTPTTQPHTTKFAYDAAHRQTSATDPLGRTTATDYDRNGWATKETDPLNKERTSEYDQRGAAVKTVEPFEGRTITTLTEYDALGNVKREISPRAYDSGSPGNYANFVTSYSYDALEQPVRVSLPKASGETQAYTHNSFDANGRLLWTSLPTTEPAAGSVAAADKTVNEYWDTGELYSTTVGGSAKVRYDATAEGWQAWRLPETAEGTGTADYGRMMFWEQYPDGQLKAERDFAGRRSSYSYDPNGNQTAASEAQSIAGDVLTIESSFNGFDELVEVKTPKIGGANQWVSRWTYDAHGNVETLLENKEQTGAGALVAAGRGFAYTYTDADEPLQQTDDFGTAGTGDDERFSFGFDAAGRLSSRTLAKSNGSGGWTTEQTSTRTYYPNGDLKSLQTLDGAGATVASHALSYTSGGVYLNGNLVSDAFRLKSPDAGASCQTADCTASWTYDGRDRLLSENTGTGSTSAFTLNAQGDITAETRNGSGYRTATYTGARLTTDTVAGVASRYLYDAYGNVDCVVAASWASPSCPTAATGQTVASELVSDNVYDYRDRLLAVRNYTGGSLGDRSEYRYDPLARPTRKISTVDGTTTTTDMLYLGVDDQVIRETETGTTTKTRAYAFDALGQRATLNENGSRYSYVVDHRESVEALLDQTNGIKAAYGYGAYGEANPSLTKTAGGFTPSTNLYRYTGKRFDPAAKAYDMGARHYFPAQARWFQQDLYADALDNLGLSTDPLNSNRYVFTGANPISYVEVDGHLAACAVFRKQCKKFAQGVGAGIRETAGAVKSGLRHPVRTAEATAAAVAHPVRTAKAVGQTYTTAYRKHGLSYAIGHGTASAAEMVVGTKGALAAVKVAKSRAAKSRAAKARDAAGRRPDGSPDRTSATYVGGTRDGRTVACGSGGGKCAEEHVQEALPGAKMTRAFGWRRDPATGKLEWTEIRVCRGCQEKYLPGMFERGTKAEPGGAWGRGR